MKIGSASILPVGDHDPMLFLITETILFDHSGWLGIEGPLRGCALHIPLQDLTLSPFCALSSILKSFEPRAQRRVPCKARYVKIFKMLKN